MNKTKVRNGSYAHQTKDMNHPVWKYCIVMMLLLLALPMQAQKFYNLTADEVKVDSMLPRFVYSRPLGEDYQDSVYTATVKYAEYVDMTVSDIANYNRISGAALPSKVVVDQRISICRKKGTLVVSFCPLVFRNNKYQMLVSFMLDIKAKPVSRSLAKAKVATFAAVSPSYASHSVLATGKWAKIKVNETGVYQLTENVVRQAGFSDINKVKIYGYGGNLQDEALYASKLLANDDLQEVPQCVVGGKHLFYAKGPVSWSSKIESRRTRNPYSDAGYYFITQTDGEPQTVDSTSFVNAFYPANDDYHSLYEVDGYSWYHGGRNLYDPNPIKVGESKTIVFDNQTGDAAGRLTVNVSAGTATTVEVLMNGISMGQQTVSIGSSYNKGGENTRTYYSLANSHVGGKDTITIKTLSGGPARLDFVSIAWNSPKPAPALSGNLPAAQYVYNITNQDLHADGATDMVIIIPTSQKLLKQAQRLKAFHESHDGLRVRIVPADELYNEFSSGTPDAGAYRRYLRMLYDRAESEADMPKYLLMFGDCVWDNRMLTSDCKNLNPDDYLLCYESENSFSELYCYVSDSWLGILSEGAGGNPVNEQQDVAVGRFPVTTVDEAKVMVDKSINYMTNDNAGAWQNTLMFMGDDGNDNLHMRDENEVADYIASLYPDYLVKKVMWDAYKRETSSTGNSYPEAAKLVKEQQGIGALVMDYAGHGSEGQLSHEKVLTLSDFKEFRNTNLPLWITAACDVMPFDGATNDNIGEAAVLNANGGAVAFYGTTRTVYANLNKYMNRAFLRRVLSIKDGKPMPIGEAHRLAQNDVLLGNKLPNGTIEKDNTTNHLQYALLGDPALSLNLPTLKVVVDSINGVALDKAMEAPVLKAGMVAKMAGHIEGATNFDGVVTATVRDSKQLVTCRNNEGNEEAFTFYDRSKTLYNGSDSVRANKFSFRFAVPKDINYSDASGLVNLYAVNKDKTQRAAGSNEQFTVGGSALARNDSIGPSIYCYLNSPSFVNGGNVNPTPYFVAEVKDKDGINAAGSGIGHDLQLVIDGDANKTYNLNNNFEYDFGTYTSGTTYYSIPELEAGPHKLQFRAWDILNNSSTATLTFNVVKNLKPSFESGVLENPARNSTTFIVTHDRQASKMDVVIEVFDTSGRMLWRHSDKDVTYSGTYTLKWDLNTGSGTLRTGIYLYRVKVASDGSDYEAKTKKLIIIN